MTGVSLRGSFLALTLRTSAARRIDAGNGYVAEADPPVSAETTEPCVELMQTAIAAAASWRALAGSTLTGNHWSRSRPLSAHLAHLVTRARKARSTAAPRQSGCGGGLVTPLRACPQDTTRARGMPGEAVMRSLLPRRLRNTLPGHPGPGIGQALVASCRPKPLHLAWRPALASRIAGNRSQPWGLAGGGPRIAARRLVQVLGEEAGELFDGGVHVLLLVVEVVVAGAVDCRPVAAQRSVTFGDGRSPGRARTSWNGSWNDHQSHLCASRAFRAHS
jgi:hypothetical protein